MYSDEDLNRAIQTGIFSQAQVDRFRLAAAGGLAQADEEQFRLLTGFNDIFVSIAILMFLTAVCWLGAQIWLPASGLAVMAASWALAEFFTRKRRQALPSMVLLSSFVGALGTAWIWCAPQSLNTLWPVTHWGNSLALFGLPPLIGAFVHWRRFQVPVTVAAALSAFWGLSLLTLVVQSPLLWSEYQNILVFLAGLVTFALAMGWDCQDRHRLTRRSDVAFWLHMLAAPLLVHPVFYQLATKGKTDAGFALAAVAAYVGLTLVALIIDRRALLISALVYVLWAISSVIESLGSASNNFGLTALVIGSALLTLSAGWKRARALVLAVTPAAIRDRVPVAA